MKAVDTNILARLVLGDDPEQASLAARVLAEPVWVTDSVWVELGWVLSKRLTMDRFAAADALATILSLDTVNTANREGLFWAIDRFRKGANWADMVHLVSAHTVATSFVSFDPRIRRDAGAEPPLPIELPA